MNALLFGFVPRSCWSEVNLSQNAVVEDSISKMTFSEQHPACGQCWQVKRAEDMTAERGNSPANFALPDALESELVSVWKCSKKHVLRSAWQVLAQQGDWMNIMKK